MVKERMLLSQHTDPYDQDLGFGVCDMRYGV